MTVESLADILEQELEDAVEVKNRKSLHRYITILTENLVRQDRNDREHSEFREAILRINTRMEEGFRRMDERFEAVEKRFEAVDKRFDDVNRRFDDVNRRFDDVNKRFSMMFTFITIGFTALATLMSVYQFLT